MHRSLGLLTIIHLALLLPAAHAQAPRERARPATQPQSQPAEADAKAGDRGKGDQLVETKHTLKVGEVEIRYAATTGTMALRDENGKHKADVFFVAYDRLDAEGRKPDRATRPITFVFNGGPGAAAVWLHLGTAGPHRVHLTEEGAAPPPPYRTVDNPHTWLDATDLVFIDPVGTGFSRAAQGEDAKQFYGVQEDVRAVGDFIRLYVTRNGRWGSPKFLAGESYGTTRAAALSSHLLDSHGIALNGIVFVSTVLNFQTISFAEGNDLPFVLFLPSYTAIAHYHGKLPEPLQKSDAAKAMREAEQFAIEEYLPALAKGESLPAEQKAQIAQKIARYTGLSEEVVRKADLRIDSSLFRKQLLLDDRTILGRFDARLKGFDSKPLSGYPEFDPSYSEFLAAYSGAFNRYVREDLNFESDLKYEVLSGRVQPWNFGGGGGFGGYLNVADDLAAAMRKNPHMKVLFASGLYDLATPYFGKVYTVNHLDLSPALRKNVSQTFYPGGHMMYHHQPTLAELHRDVAKFIGGATK